MTHAEGIINVFINTNVRQLTNKGELFKFLEETQETQTFTFSVGDRIDIKNHTNLMSQTNDNKSEIMHLFETLEHYQYTGREVFL